MRQSYLESYYNLIPKTQQDRLLSVIKERYDSAGQSPDDSSIQKQLEILVTQLKKPLGDPLVQLRKASKFGKISSNDYNNTMDEVYIDLGALYKQNNTINQTIKIHKLLNETVLKDVRSALSKVENDIMVHKVIKENKTGITDAIYNTFYKEDNVSTDKVYAAYTDVDTNSIKLPVGLSQSSLTIDGLALAEIDIVHYGGGIKGTIEDESHRKEKAIDGSSETFWGEVILTDEPIRQVYDGSTYFGAICEVVISLFRSDLVNHVKINPFSNYPLTVVKILYAETSTGSWVDLGVASQSSTSVMEFNFSEVLTKQIKIVLNQRNPSVNTYKIPRRVINNAQLWQQIVDREYSISTESESPIQATQDMIDYITGWKAYVDATSDFKDKITSIGKPSDYEQTGSISESIFDAASSVMTKTGSGDESSSLKLNLYGKRTDKDSELVEARKYEYVYGAYEIDVRKVWYMESGEYISPTYSPNGTIIEARMDATEVVPSGTSIEYQVATRFDEWKNILPSGVYINQERLDIDSITQTGYLRFPCTGSLGAVYRNDDKMPTGDYTFNATTGEVVISSGWYMASSAFTVSYTPKGITDVIPSGVVVSFANDTLIRSDEVYRETGSRQYKVTLEHFPYVNYNIVNDTSEAGKTSPNFSYEDGRYLNSSGGTLYDIAPAGYYDILEVKVDGFDAINMTDYFKNIRPALTLYDFVNYPYYEYIHSGKNLYFNSPLDGKEIKVRYYYLNDFIQFRALLRNNNRGNVSVTPVLNDFTLKLRTI